METKVALMAVVVENPDKVDELNKLLHQFNDFIVGRMGLPMKERNISLISLAIDAPSDEISSLSGKIGMIEGVSSKVVYAKTE